MRPITAKRRLRSRFGALGRLTEICIYLMVVIASGALDAGSLAALRKRTLTPGAEIEVRLDDDTTASGLFYSFSGQDNVVALLSLLNRQVKTTLPFDMVQPG